MWHSMHFHFFQLKLFPVSTNQGEYQRVWHQHLIALWLWGNDLIFLSLSFLYCKMWGAVPFSWGCFEEGERNYCVEGAEQGLGTNPVLNPLLMWNPSPAFLPAWQIQSHSTGCQASRPRHVINSLGRQFAFKEKQAEGMKTRQPAVSPAQPWARTVWHLAASAREVHRPETMFLQDLTSSGLSWNAAFVGKICRGCPTAPVPAYSKPTIAWNYLALIFPCHWGPHFPLSTEFVFSL